MDYGEDPEDAVIRELKEETGVEGSNPISIAVHGEPTRDPRKHVIALFYLVDVDSDSIPTAGDDASEAYWVPLDAVTKDEIAGDHIFIMDRKLRIDTGGKSYAPYSPGISVRDHIWLSGQIDITESDIESQTRGTLAKIDDLLEAANSSKRDLVKVTVLMSDIAFYSKINEVYGEWISDSIAPSRAAYAVSDLPLGALVEIVCEAFRGSGSSD